jgi:hypothetical protein
MCGQMRKDKIHIPFKTRVRRWKGHVHIPFKILARWVSILFFTVVAGCFVYATVSAWKIAGSARVGCSYTVNPDVMAASYLQYNIKDQAIEPLFNGSLFISLGDVPSGPARVVVTTSGKKGIYGDTITVADFYHDEVANTIWMKAESTPVSFYRKSGSHRDFPFDSATINADTSFNPTVKLRFVTLRNANTSFYVPCGSTKVTSDASGSIHLSFEMRPKPPRGAGDGGDFWSRNIVRVRDPVCGKARKSTNLSGVVLFLHLVPSRNTGVRNEGVPDDVRPGDSLAMRPSHTTDRD